MTTWDDLPPRDKVLGLAHDAAIQMMHDDRKECEYFQRGDIEKLIADGVVSIDDMAEQFRKTLLEFVEGGVK